MHCTKHGTSQLTTETPGLQCTLSACASSGSLPATRYLSHPDGGDAAGDGTFGWGSSMVP